MASICRSLQCLISALTQAVGGGLLFRFACSVVVLWGRRGAADKCQWRVWGGPAVFRPHWVCPAHGCVLSHLHCSGSRLLSRERALSCMWFQFSGTPQKRRLGWACVLCLPHLSSSGSWELDKCPLPRCGLLYPLRGPSLSFHALRLGAPCVCSGELVSSCDPLGGRQPSRIS